jgi:ligand-binding SRPBCC domain-containing protein
MEKQVFNISINAPREKVWNILWSKDSYKAWTAPFAEGSHAETDWKKGSKVLFLDGKGSGMVSTVAENIPNEYMSFEHLGEIKNGVEDLDSPNVKQWAGAHENYTLKTVNGKTELKIDMDVTDEFKEMFRTIWPKALDKIKELSESNN